MVTRNLASEVRTLLSYLGNARLRVAERENYMTQINAKFDLLLAKQLEVINHQPTAEQTATTTEQTASVSDGFERDDSPEEMDTDWQGEGVAA